MATVADTLEMAADKLEAPGAWTQGAFSRNADGSADLDPDELAATEPVCFCAMGAIAAICDVDPLASFAWFGSNPASAAYATLRSTLAGYSDVPEWNDAPERTQAEVVSALRAAAAKARES